MVNGWLVIDKPQGMSSAQVVARVKRILNAKKVGHAGTLDPLATGVLLIALGEATKTVSYLMNTTKVYHCLAKWGEQTTTDDTEGEVVQRSEVRPTVEDIRAALPHFTGQIDQRPPIYSAIKVEGKRAYALARTHQEVHLAARPVVIDHLRLLSIKGNDFAAFEVECQKGTYIRSLIRDLALALGTLGHAYEIRRTQVGKFTLEMSISLEKLFEMRHNIETMVFPIEKVLDDISAVRISDQEKAKLIQGQIIKVSPKDIKICSKAPKEILCLSQRGQAVALAVAEEGYIRPKKVFNL